MIAATEADRGGSSPARKIIVVGAGVSGLSCAVLLLERGHRVEVWTRDLPSRTTSSVSAAFWYPYLVRPEEACLRWGGATLLRFAELLDVPAAGIRMRRARSYYDHPVADPDWIGQVPTTRRARADELPAGYRDGFVFDIPVIEMPIYLRYLADRVEALGGTIATRDLRTLDEALDAGDAVVNCAGLGARELVRDREMFAVRGQVVRVSRAGMDDVIFDSYGPGGPTYIVPRGEDCILGGTAEEGREDLEPDPATTADILVRCVRFDPRVRAAERLGEMVGLRPCRSAVRLEADHSPSGTLIVHNYGHGGAGVTLSWGCAADVAGLIASGGKGALPA